MMVFSAPISGVFGNYLIPLMIGAPDMAFPFFNELSFWLFFSSGVIWIASFFVPGYAAAGGWTSYPPLSSEALYNGTKIGQSLWCVAIFVNGLSSISGAFNYITTIVNMRAPGMTMFRLPMAVWSLFVTAFLVLLAVPVLSATVSLVWLDLNGGTTFFSGQNGTHGDPLLYQHLFWFFGHPEVYIMILPAMGEKIGRWNFWLMFVFFNLTFFPMHTMGLAGMQRHISDPTQYEHLRNLQPLQKFISLSAFGLGAAFLVFVWNFFYSMFRGENAPANPWRATTLEWTLPSPVTLHGNFEQVPRVYHGPYEYSIPGMREDYLPQNVPMPRSSIEPVEPVEVESPHAPRSR